MKKIILLSLCLVSIGIQAQQVRFIPKAGVNIANMTDSDGADPRIGLNAGVGAEIAITPEFVVEPGIFYSMQGIKESEGGTTATMKNDYINIPVLAKYYVYEGLNLFAGPQVGFIVNSKLGLDGSALSVSVDTKDVFKAIDFGVVLGAGYQLPMGLNFSVNYNLGLLNVFEDNPTITVEGESIDLKELLGGVESKNNVIQVSVGWRF